MKIKIEVYGALCELSEFEINGVDAYWEDFGEKYDDEPDEAEPYGCGDMRFFKKFPKQEVLDKYDISLTEYEVICYKLGDLLSFGNCGWCV